MSSRELEAEVQALLRYALDVRDPAPVVAALERRGVMNAAGLVEQVRTGYGRLMDTAEREALRRMGQR